MHLVPRLKSLKVECLRNIRWVELDIDAPLVMISGANGAGKTTLLEAIYLLARGRSFRGRKAGTLTTLGEDRTRIAGWIDSIDREALEIRYLRDSTGSRREFYPYAWMASSQERSAFQVKLIGENSQMLLEGEPSLRRRFLDWNVFHVEPSFASVRAEFGRILTQRNAALRYGRGQHVLWDKSFLDAAEHLESLRRAFFEEWRNRFLEVCRNYPFLADHDFIYRRGWPTRQTLEDALESARQQEMIRGYTLIGPSRADFTIENRATRAGFSRGQSKVIFSLLQLSAECVLRSRGCGCSIWLLDDLETELDTTVAQQLCDAFCATGSQIIASRVSATPKPASFFQATSANMFHVEHGAVVKSH